MIDFLISIFYVQYKAILTWIGDLMCAVEPPKVKAFQILKFICLIKPGDIVCRKYVYHMDSYLIPGEYTHSAIVIDSNEMVHAIAQGVKTIHPIDFIKDCDSFILLRPNYPNESHVNTAINAARSMIGKEYDFAFNDLNKFYCHELTAECIKGCVKVEKTKKVFGWGIFKIERDVYLSDNIINSCETIYEFK